MSGKSSGTGIQIDSTSTSKNHSELAGCGRTSSALKGDLVRTLLGFIRA